MFIKSNSVTHTIVHPVLAVILSAVLQGKNLIVTGDFDSQLTPNIKLLSQIPEGTKIFIDGERHKKTLIDAAHPTTTLIGKKAGNKIAPGQTVKLQVKFPNGTLTPEFTFTRPTNE